MNCRYPRSPLVNTYPVSTRPVRKQLDPSTHYPVRFGATFFITICCEARVANQLCREDIGAGVVRNRPLLSRYSEIVFKNPTLDARPSAHAGWHSRRRSLSNLVRDFKNASLRRSQESIGSEIFAIIDCGTMKVRQKNLNTSAGTLCGQV